MPKQRGHQLGDICYQTGLSWRALVHLIRPKSGREGHYLREIRIVFKPEKVLVILKKDGPKGPQIGFIESESFDEAIWVMGQAVKAKQINWKADKWGSMRIDKK